MWHRSAAMGGRVQSLDVRHTSSICNSCMALELVQLVKISHSLAGADVQVGVVQELDLRHVQRLSAKDLAQICSQGRVQSLDIRHTSVRADAPLCQALAQLTRLQSLSLSDTR